MGWVLLKQAGGCRRKIGGELLKKTATEVRGGGLRGLHCSTPDPLRTPGKGYPASGILKLREREEGAGGLSALKRRA